MGKEFYFVRHGETDHNRKEGPDKGDHPPDISLNEVGETQARLIEPIIASLPIQTICASPLRRVQQTKALITPRLEVPHYEFHELGECSALIWKEMSKYGMYALPPLDGAARNFMERVQKGIDEVLKLPGPALVIAHGGVHWALCCLLGIRTHEWAIHNCGVVHFTQTADQGWKTVLLA